jgi:hypothetical protein
MTEPHSSVESISTSTPPKNTKAQHAIACWALSFMPKAGLEPACLAAPPPQDGVSANSTTSAKGKRKLTSCSSVQQAAWRDSPSPELPGLMRERLRAWNRHPSGSPISSSRGRPQSSGPATSP